MKALWLIFLLLGNPAWARDLSDIARPLATNVTLSRSGSGTHFFKALWDIKQAHFAQLGPNICKGVLAPSEEWQWFEYAEVEGLPGVFVFNTVFQESLNQAFVRLAAIKGEIKGVPKGVLAPSRVGSLSELNGDTEAVLHARNNARRENEFRGSGHNIPGRDFQIMRQLLAQKAASPSWYAPNWAEAAVLNAVETDTRFLAYGDKFYVIGMPVQNAILSEASTSISTLAHEILHALFYLNQDYQRVVRAFWASTLTSEERDEVKRALHMYGADPDVFIDEFQAYLLEPGAATNYLRNLVPTRQPQLIQALRGAGIELPVVESPALDIF